MHESFQRLSDQSPIVRPVLWVWLLTLSTTAAMLPVVRVAYQDQPDPLLQAVSTGLWLVAGFAPLVALAKALLLGGVGWAVLVLVGVLPRFRTLVSTALYGEALLAVQGLWVALVLHLRGNASLTEPADLMVFTGLDIFVRDMRK